MKKVLMAFLVLVGFVVFTACDAQASEVDVLTSNRDIYAFSAISSSSLLITQGQANPVSMKLSDSEEPLIEDEIEDINKYINMMEQFLGDNHGFSVENQESDRLDYAYKVVFTGSDLSGNVIQHVFYYNEEVIVENSIDDLTEEIEEEEEDTEKEDDEQEEDKDDDEKDEFEDQETTLSGILIMNEVEYAITGKKEIEENEVKIEIKSFFDELNYVNVVSKTEDNERKYFYEVVSNGVLVTSSKLKIEEEDNELKFELEYTQGGITGFFEFKQEIEDDENIIKIQYEINNMGVIESGEAKILVITDPVTHDTTYQYIVKTNDGDEFETEKERDDEFDEEDDDNDEEEDTSL